jgi:hypothetical protein
VLAADGLDVTANLAAFAAAQRRLADGRPAPGDEALRVRAVDIVLVDEASMITTADLSAVREAVEAAGARLVLAGDPRQLGAVGAGGVMGLLAGASTGDSTGASTAGGSVGAETYTLSDVRRFTADWEAAASLQLRDGDPAGLAEYDLHGRILDCPDLDAAVASAARSVVADLTAGRSTLAVADTNTLAARVSVKVRDELLALGLLPAQTDAAPDAGPDGVRVVELTRDGVTAGVGDVVEFRRNDRALGVVNRGRGSIMAVGDDGSVVVQTAAGASGGGEAVRLPAGYVAEHVSLGYCTTIHGAQGQTVDTCHLVTSGGGDAAALYVGLSRGRDRNTAHVALAAERREGQPAADVANAVPAPTGAAVLSDVLGRTGLDAAATVTAETDRARRESAATVLAEYEDAVRQVCRTRLESQLDTLTAEGHLHADDRARLCADQGTEHLSRLLRAVEQSGHHPDQVLRAAIQERRGFGDAALIAQVISSRITGPTVLGAPAAEAAAQVPAGIPAEHAAHLELLHADLDQRRHTLGAHLAAQRAAEQQPPGGWPRSVLSRTSRSHAWTGRTEQGGSRSTARPPAGPTPTGGCRTRPGSPRPNGGRLGGTPPAPSAATRPGVTRSR